MTSPLFLAEEKRNMYKRVEKICARSMCNTLWSMAKYLNLGQQLKW